MDRGTSQDQVGLLVCGDVLDEAAHDPERIFKTIPARDLNDEGRLERRRWAGVLDIAMMLDAGRRTVETTETRGGSAWLRAHDETDVLKNGADYLRREILVFGTERIDRGRNHHCPFTVQLGRDVSPPGKDVGIGGRDEGTQEFPAAHDVLIDRVCADVAPPDDDGP